MSRFIGPLSGQRLWRYVPFTSRNPRRILITDSILHTNRISSNCAVAESCRIWFLTLSRFPCGHSLSLRHFLLCLNLIDEILTNNNLIPSNLVFMYFDVRIQPVTFQLILHRFFEEPLWRKFHPLSGDLLTTHGLIYLVDIFLFVWI